MARKIMMRKRRRVFSQETNKLIYIMFARNYVKNLLISLEKIKSNKISSNDDNHQNGNLENLRKTVKYEAEMAMALSASQFAWGHAMKEKLKKTPSNGNEDDHNLSPPMVKFSRENCMKVKRKKCSIKKRKDLKENEEQEKEEEDMENGLKNLRMILPGGGDGVMEVDDLLKQTESYIKCLELQVKILRCLVDE